MKWVEKRVKELGREVKDGEERVAGVWVLVVNANVRNADTPCRIKPECRAISRPARNAEVRWQDRKARFDPTFSRE